MNEHRSEIALREQGEPSKNWLDEFKRLLSELVHHRPPLLKTSSGVRQTPRSPRQPRSRPVP